MVAGAELMIFSVWVLVLALVLVAGVCCCGGWWLVLVNRDTLGIISRGATSIDFVPGYLLSTCT